jgi:hypothetical protein
MNHRAGTPRWSQFTVRSLFAVTAFVALTCAVLRLPVPLTEKFLVLIVVGQCYMCWRGRNYLHPLQGWITYESRRRVARLDFFSSLTSLPFLIGIYFWAGWRDRHGIRLADVVFCGAIIALVGLAAWKFRRGLDPSHPWVSTIPEPEPAQR